MHNAVIKFSMFLASSLGSYGDLGDHDPLSTMNKTPTAPPQKIDYTPWRNFLCDSGLPMVPNNWFEKCFTSGNIRKIRNDQKSDKFPHFLANLQS